MLGELRSQLECSPQMPDCVVVPSGQGLGASDVVQRPRVIGSTFESCL
jgi:hypothetical protein